MAWGRPGVEGGSLEGKPFLGRGVASGLETPASDPLCPARSPQTAGHPVLPPKRGWGAQPPPLQGPGVNQPWGQRAQLVDAAEMGLVLCMEGGLGSREARVRAWPLPRPSSSLTGPRARTRGSQRCLVQGQGHSS